MGGKCCHDSRKDGPASAVKDTSRKSAHNAFANQNKRAFSIGYKSQGDDADKFDQAFAKVASPENLTAANLKAFVDLLSSEQAIDSFEEPMHPWAKDPATVGALAGTQLAILASAEDSKKEGEASVKNAIREAGAIKPLVEFLKSKEEDRQQIGVVALSFLTADCPENTQEAYNNGALPHLKGFCDSPVAGMRAASSTTLRNICVEDPKYRAAFVKLGGIEDLVKQLDTQEDKTLKHADVQLEAILNLQDMIEEAGDNPEGTLVPEYAELAIKAGAEKLLEALTKNEDSEVATSASEVLAALESFKEEQGTK